MGDRIIIHEMECPYCNKINKDVGYAPSCGIMSRVCEHCKKEFLIEEIFCGRKATKKEIKKFYKDMGFGR